MKSMKKMYLLWVAVLVAVGMTACSKEDKVVSTENGVGGVVLSFGLGKSVGTRAVTPSTAKPNTTWRDNIKDLMVLFVEDGRVKDARTIEPVPTSSDLGVKNVVFTNIKASADNKTYDIYVIANSQQANIRAEKGNGKIWDMSTCVGASVTDLMMKLVENPDFVRSGQSEANAVGYKEPAEIFVARQTGITIVVDENNEIQTPFQLERVISLMRVRIDQSKNGNDRVSFADADASFRIRRATTSVNPLKTIARGNVDQVLFTKGGFKTTDPTSGYNGGTILNPAENITLWQDIRMLPGGSADKGSEKFDILLIGKAPAGYYPLGVDSPLTEPADVAWTAAVGTPVDPNYILEINLILERAGIWLDNPADPGIPEPGKYGNAGIFIKLTPWGQIVSEDIPL